MRPAWIREWYRVRSGYGVAQTRYGWGVVPAAWQGWLMTVGMLLLAGGIARLADQRSALYQLLFLPLFVGFVWLSWLKTDGGWRWRWGERD